MKCGSLNKFFFSSADLNEISLWKKAEVTTAQIEIEMNKHNMEKNLVTLNVFGGRFCSLPCLRRTSSRFAWRSTRINPPKSNVAAAHDLFAIVFGYCLVVTSFWCIYSDPFHSITTVKASASVIYYKYSVEDYEYRYYMSQFVLPTITMRKILTQSNTRRWFSFKHHFPNPSQSSTPCRSTNQCQSTKLVVNQRICWQPFNLKKQRNLNFF